MSIKVQKIIRFIPVINFITVILWFRMYLTKYIDKKYLFKTGICMVGAMALVNVPQIILSRIIDSQSIMTIINLVCSYLTLFAMSYFAVKDQERIAIEVGNDN